MLTTLLKTLNKKKQNPHLITVHLFKRTMQFAYGVWST